MFDIKFTYPIALGPSGVSHEVIENRFSEELEGLRDPKRNDNYFYSKVHGCDTRVHVELICSIMDQPERRGTNCMMGRNSSFGAR